MEKLTKKQRKELKKFEWQEKLKSQKRNEMLKKIAIWAGAALLLILSVWGLIALSSSSPDQQNSSTRIPQVSKEDIKIGSESARITLVEYSDFQCPACAAYHPMVNQLISEFEGRMLFVYRFFPIQSHQNAMISAQSSLAAHKQGKFFEMYNLLFDNQNSWVNSSNAEKIFVEYAGKLNLDIDKFKSDLKKDETKNLINNQYSQAIAIGVNSTPTFFLNGVKIQNPRTYDDFKNLIQNELNKK
ncbi:MAG: hypothetical protein A2958_00135 [Candidatus Levybacteria bacterium RIFCSPLOWO2_01_FULL_38_13]|nr:MAG: hypothetical protein A2629_02220 [Candidatus Levybacteria bacterium RIFCSPHIGHO2_01_FULL_41_15]OGH34948.1 MAG: hypothetical protein A2958_00135 [Candidatus Levybacteria bacterium RIFCSPLOWO2_01_FULL_38_13]